MAAPIPLVALDAAPPDSLALKFPDRELSYGDLAAHASAVAARVSGARRVAIWAEARIETAVGVVGCLLAGTPVALINPKSGVRELEHVLGDSDPDVLLVASEVDLPPAAGGRNIHATRLGDPSPRHPMPPEPDPETPALIVYTSGTTGSPKGAVLPRRAIASTIDALADAWQWTAADVVVHALPLFHVHGLVLGTLGPLRLGGTVQHLGRFSTEAVGEALEGAGTVLFGVPTMYRRLADAAEGDARLRNALGRARLLVSGSAALPRIEHERLARLSGRPVLERYGLTETLINTAVRADEQPRPGSVGTPLAGVELRLVSDAGTEVAAGDDAIGEIEVRGPNLFLEYLNAEEPTRAAFRDGWFRTGDIARRSADGWVTIVGRRATDLIKSGGYKIGAGEIEVALREHPAVDDAAVTGEPDPDLGERVVAWVVLRDGASVEAEELTRHVASLLAPHKRPRGVRFITELPRNELGKVQKRRLTPP